jgi:hypothetical protein
MTMAKCCGSSRGYSLLGSNHDDNWNSYTQLRELSEQVFVIMNNVISQGVDCRLALCQAGASSPIMVATAELKSVFSKNFPREWPCQISVEINWNYSVSGIARYFSDKPPRLLRRWVVAFRKLVQWAESVRQHEEEFTLCMLIVAVDELHRNGRININIMTVGMFAVKKSMQLGGNMQLVVVSDVLEWIGDFYAWIFERRPLSNSPTPLISSHVYF